MMSTRSEVRKKESEIDLELGPITHMYRLGPTPFDEMEGESLSEKCVRQFYCQNSF